MAFAHCPAARGRGRTRGLQHTAHPPGINPASSGASRGKAGPPQAPSSRRLPSAPRSLRPRRATHTLSSWLWPCPQRSPAAAGSHGLRAASLQSRGAMHTHHGGPASAVSASSRGWPGTRQTRGKRMQRGRASVHTGRDPACGGFQDPGLQKQNVKARPLHPF